MLLSRSNWHDSGKARHPGQVERDTGFCTVSVIWADFYFSHLSYPRISIMTPYYSNMWKPNFGELSSRNIPVLSLMKSWKFPNLSYFHHVFIINIVISTEHVSNILLKAKSFILVTDLFTGSGQHKGSILDLPIIMYLSSVVKESCTFHEQ